MDQHRGRRHANGGDTRRQRIVVGVDWDTAVGHLCVPNVPAGTYALSVRAANATGVSAASNAVTLTFPGPCSGVPATPTNFLATKNGNLISVSWGLPASGPAPTAYTLTVQGAFSGSLQTASRAISGAVGTGSYVLSVAANNPCGTGAATATQTVIVP